MKKIWKEIKNYEGLYQISNCGEIMRIQTKNILKQKTDKRNYKRVILSKNGITKTYLVHRLVAKAFIPNLENKPYINHLDEDPSNNNVNNLEWVTNSENLKYNNCLKKGKRIKQGKKIKQYDKRNNFIAEYGSISEASEKTNINKTAISSCCKGRSKTSGGYIWRFV